MLGIAGMPVRIIQGGMGVGVSGWPLARAVSRCGQLGVVSGTGLAVVLARRLQTGDNGGHMRRALAQLPIPGVADRILERYFIAGGKPESQSFKLTPLPHLPLDSALSDLTVAANFAEVFLAKDGHDGLVGINYLEKLQIPALASLFGAMLAGVDYVLMGAGIPRSIPGVLDALSQGLAAELRIDVEGYSGGEATVCRFDPKDCLGRQLPKLRRPMFLPIVSSATLAMTLARKSNGRVDGFVVEGAMAGGHNAPPRGNLQLNARGEPIYGPRDQADLEKIRELRLPFWLAGGFGHPGKLAEAMALGASGIQVGTAFAFCAESSIDEAIKRRAIQLSREGALDVHTCPAASPTGFPFKVLRMSGTLSDEAVYAARPRICDLGYLRHAYQRDDGTVGFRCPAEPIEDFVRKGGLRTDAIHRKCICNALFSTIGLGQIQHDGTQESPLVTAGDDARDLAQLLDADQQSYTAADVVRHLLQPQELPVA